MVRRWLLLLVSLVCPCLLFLQDRPNAASEAKGETFRQIEELIQKGDLKTARNRLLHALKDSPKQAGYEDLLGVVEAEEGHYIEAEIHFIRAIEEDSHLTGAYLNLGHLYQDKAAGNPRGLEKALATYRKLLVLERHNVEGLYQTAFLLERSQQYNSSLQYLDRLPPGDQHRSQALAVRCADLAGLRKESQSALVVSDLLLAPDLAEADVFIVIPVLESCHNDGLEAQLLEGLAGRGLASPASLGLLGTVYMRGNQLQKARDTLEKAALVQPNSVPLLLDLAHVAHEQNDDNGAIAYLARARDLDPENASIHFFNGVIYAQQNRIPQAYESLKKAVGLQPNNAYYNYAMGAVTLERDPDESVRFFRRYCELKPRDPHGRLALGAAYFYAHDDEPAMKELEAAANGKKPLPGAHYFLGCIASRQGNLVQAVNQFNQSLQENPRYADAYAELGIVRMKQKQNKLAETALLNALKIDPDHYIANLNLMILYQRTKDSRAARQARRVEEIKQLRQAIGTEFLRSIKVAP